MLDVNAAFGQAEIRLVIAPAGFRDLVFVDWLVLEFDAVFVEPVGDLQLFVVSVLIKRFLAPIFDLLLPRRSPSR